jgi:TrmH family RNA methyltransferase
MAIQKYKHASKTSFALGATLVAELFNTRPELIVHVFLRPVEKHGADLDAILAKLRAKNIEIIESKKAFNILGAKENCLLAAEFTKPDAKLDDKTPHIILVNPSDAGNLGTIIRTAAAFGYKNLCIITPAVDPYDPKVIRASMGAIFHLNIVQFDDFANYQAQNQDRKLFAFLLDQNATQLDDVEKPANQNYALVLGNEAAGLPKDFATKTGAESVFIPQSDDVDSLNLSVAAALAMYHFSIH